MTYQPATISPALLDAKGDLIIATAADTPARLAVGGNNSLVIADSTATEGVRWVSAITTLIKWGMV